MDRHVLSHHVNDLLIALQVSIKDVSYSTRDGIVSSVLSTVFA